MCVAQALDNWKSAADYQLWHAVAAGSVPCVGGAALPRRAGWCCVAGVVVFRGSLYALALTDRRRLGAITPFGGVLLLIGWALLLVAAIRG